MKIEFKLSSKDTYYDGKLEGMDVCFCRAGFQYRFGVKTGKFITLDVRNKNPKQKGFIKLTCDNGDVFFNGDQPFYDDFISDYILKRGGAVWVKPV